MDEPLDNLCQLLFNCQRNILDKNIQCVYYKPLKEINLEKDLYYCEYNVNRSGLCHSKIAQANRMVLLLKKEGLNFLET